jgi:hypothetical protein
VYPNYESFYDNLKDRNVKIKEYERGRKLWDYFKKSTEREVWSFKEYMELYLTFDVLIIADCFESFRDLSLNTMIQILLITHRVPVFHGMLRQNTLK